MIENCILSVAVDGAPLGETFRERDVIDGPPLGETFRERDNTDGSPLGETFRQRDGTLINLKSCELWLIGVQG